MHTNAISVGITFYLYYHDYNIHNHVNSDTNTKLCLRVHGKRVQMRRMPIAWKLEIKT